MTQAARTVQDEMYGQLMAFDELSGLSCLHASLDGVDMASAEALTIHAGERFTVAQGVAYVPIMGLLTPNMFALERYFGWSTYYGLEQTLQQLGTSEDVRGVVLLVNSPGGMVRGIEVASDAIAAVALQKPVHALVHPLAASSAYWLAAQATEVVMTPGSETGCIGTVTTRFHTVAADLHGEQQFSFSSGMARAKVPDPTTEEGRAEIMRSLNEAEARFHAAVSAGRNIPSDALALQLSVSDDPQDGGALFGPQDAVARGLADRVETHTAFMARIASLYAPETQAASAQFAARVAVARARSVL